MGALALVTLRNWARTSPWKRLPQPLPDTIRHKFPGMKPAFPKPVGGALEFQIALLPGIVSIDHSVVHAAT